MSVCPCVVKNFTVSAASRVARAGRRVSVQQTTSNNRTLSVLSLHHISRSQDQTGSCGLSSHLSTQHTSALDICASMVFLEHVGFGGRDRQLWLYYWDERDGADFCGWWVTPDYVGNHDYLISSHESADTPDKCSLGSWRSPNVEQLQLKRQLQIGFKASTANGGLTAVGQDANTPICPDHQLRIDFSKMEWRQEGLNHGKPCYVAYDLPQEAPAAKGQAKSDNSPLLQQPAVVLAVGIAAGALAMLAVQRWS